MFQLIGMIVIGAVAGYVAGLLYKGKGFGFLKNMLLGIAGSIVGGFLLRLIGFASFGIIGSIISALLGALALLWAFNTFMSKK
jgi:uncharacterized membrane protein YeaQ/YmgE (transglycosylase-associated protein family)